jgi:cytosine deaminase
MPSSLLLRNVRPYGETATDILVENGKITRVAADIEAPAGATVEDGRGEIVIPGLIEAHTHLDKSLWGLPWYKSTRSAQSCSTRSTMSALNKKRLNIDPYASRPGRASSPR